MPFFLPQSLAKPSNQVSYCGTKWLHCKNLRVLVWARASATNGADTRGANPADPAATPDVLRKSRRVTERFLLFPPGSIAHLPFLTIVMTVMHSCLCVIDAPGRAAFV